MWYFTTRNHDGTLYNNDSTIQDDVLMEVPDMVMMPMRRGVEWTIEQSRQTPQASAEVTAARITPQPREAALHTINLHSIYIQLPL